MPRGAADQSESCCPVHFYHGLVRHGTSEYQYRDLCTAELLATGFQTRLLFSRWEPVKDAPFQEDLLRVPCEDPNHTVARL